MKFTVAIEVSDAQVEQLRERAKKLEVANVEEMIQRFVQVDCQEIFAQCAGDSQFPFPDVFEMFVKHLKESEQI